MRDYETGGVLTRHSNDFDLTASAFIAQTLGFKSRRHRVPSLGVPRLSARRLEQPETMQTGVESRENDKFENVCVQLECRKCSSPFGGSARRDWAA